MTKQELEQKIETLEEKIGILEQDIDYERNKNSDLESQIRELEDDLDNKEWDKEEFTSIFDKEIQDAILYEKPILINTYMNKNIFILVS